VTWVEYGLTISAARFTVTSMPRRTALIVAVPEAEEAVGGLRLRYDRSAPLGVPAHITILFPFAPPEQLDEKALASLFATGAPFDFQLARLETFPGEVVTYLAPEPAQPFVALTNAVWRRWTEYPPYEGIHDVVIPHLTLSDSGRLDVELELPIAARAREVTLIEEGADGRWAERAIFALGPD
jgi:2'-5' RNA ligase